jgi:hypothetical protein
VKTTDADTDGESAPEPANGQGSSDSRNAADAVQLSEVQAGTTAENVVAPRTVPEVRRDEQGGEGIVELSEAGNRGTSTRERGLLREAAVLGERSEQSDAGSEGTVSAKGRAVRAVASGTVPGVYESTEEGEGISAGIARNTTGLTADVKDAKADKSVAVPEVRGVSVDTGAETQGRIIVVETAAKAANEQEPTRQVEA